MLKFAIFVEGQTERIFIEHFLKEYLTCTDYSFESQKIIGEKFVIIRSQSRMDTAQYQFLIYDVGNDEKVTSSIVDRAKNMIENQDYKFILGLRDLYSNERTQKCSVVKSIKEQFANTGYSSQLGIVLAVMEIESWFLADSTLFEKINARLTIDYVVDKLDYNLQSDSPELLDKPSNQIDKIYRLVGKRYTKDEDCLYELISRIDYCRLCFDDCFIERINSFKYFLNKFDTMVN